MSIQASEWVWRNSRTSGGARLVLLAFANHADSDGKAWPSASTLADETRMTTRAVQKHIAALRISGEIVEVGRASRGVVIYQINMRTGVRTNEHSYEQKDIGPTNQRSQAHTNKRSYKPSREPSGNHPVPTGTAASVPETADLKTRIFGPAREWLGQQTGKSDTQIRKLLGMWCSRYGDGRTLEALQCASRNAPLDPIPYITRLLTEKPNGNRLGWDEQREADLAAIFAAIAPELGAMAAGPAGATDPQSNDHRP